ncbi:MAG: mechanosensitive ion channel protein MscS [Robiginitomaculum sp.]|nr:MAG: mechanosensitive ion channel protein MscS [Robiginitomaculum sp.]
MQTKDIEDLTRQSEALARKALSWAQDSLLSLDMAVQAGAIALALLFAFVLSPHVKAVARHLVQHEKLKRFLAPLRPYLAPLARAILLFIALVAAQYALQLGERPVALVRILGSLTGAWILIRLISNLIAEPFWAKTVANIAWALAALNIFGMIGPVTNFLGTPLGFKIGTKDFSVLLMLDGIILASILLWLASWLSRVLRQRINTLPSLTPSIRLLLSKAVQVTLLTVAVLITMTRMGFDLSSLAIIGGALSFGIGFGLQRIFANFISGIILLMDRSIKPGDVIEVDDTYGRISSLGLRYTSVVTRDRKEHLIPNESFVTGKVVNWSFSTPEVRVKRPVGIAYGADVHKAIALAIACMDEVPRVLRSPKPACLLKNFGDSSVDLELRFWIRDAENGVSNISSEVLLKIWDSFKKNGIDFPYPQRDVHLHADVPIPVKIDR